MDQTSKKTKGRRKVEMKPIGDESKRHVAFSKRKAGLFNKAAELNVLTGAEVAAIVFSRQGKAYTFGTPGSDSAFTAWLARRDGAGAAGVHIQRPNLAAEGAAGAGEAAWRELRGLEDANRRLVERRRRAVKSAATAGLGFWWEVPESSLETAEELAVFEKALVELRKKVEERAAAVNMRQTLSLSAMLMGGGEGGSLLVAEERDVRTDYANVGGGGGTNAGEEIINGMILSSPSSEVYN